MQFSGAIVLDPCWTLSDDAGITPLSPWEPPHESTPPHRAPAARRRPAGRPPARPGRVLRGAGEARPAAPAGDRRGPAPSVVPHPPHRPGRQTLPGRPVAVLARPLRLPRLRRTGAAAGGVPLRDRA